MGVLTIGIAEERPSCILCRLARFWRQVVPLRSGHPHGCPFQDTCACVHLFSLPEEGFATLARARAAGCEEARVHERDRADSMRHWSRGHLIYTTILYRATGCNRKVSEPIRIEREKLALPYDPISIGNLHLRPSHAPGTKKKRRLSPSGLAYSWLRVLTFCINSTRA